MAKKLKTPLQMRNGVAARTMSDFREAFDYKLVLGYMHDGRLKKWLSERGYEAEAEKLENLQTPNSKDICEILGVPYNMEYDDYDSQEVADEHVKMQRLKGYTDDEKLLARARCAAFTQKDLDDLIGAGEKEVLLVSKEFYISLDVKGITYICISRPIVNVRSKDLIDFKLLHIRFEGDYQFNNDYQKIIDRYSEINNASNNDSLAIEKNKSSVDKRDKDFMDDIIVTFQDDQGNERYFVEEIRIPLNGYEYALLVGLNVEEDENFAEEDNVTIAKIVKNIKGDDEYIVDFPEEEFDAVVVEYNKIMDEAEDE